MIHRLSSDDVEENNETALTPGEADSSGDGITDQTAAELGLDPDRSYPQTFVSALNYSKGEDPEYADELTDAAIDGTELNESYRLMVVFR